MKSVLKAVGKLVIGLILLALSPLAIPCLCLILLHEIGEK